MKYRYIIFIFFMILLLLSPSSAENNSQKNSPDYKSGYKKGYAIGKDHAKGGAGMPYDIGLNIMAEGFAKQSKSEKPLYYENGFKAGFKDGFTGVKPYKWDSRKYENLSWENAKVGVKLYDNNGKHIVTIVSIDNENGIIKVKYVKKGIVEPKKLEALSPYWFVKRKPSTKKK